MSDFLIHAARMQDAGVRHLTVTLGTADDRTRLMYVSVDRDQPLELQQRFLKRTFELCGTDRVLEKLKDNMLYSDDGVTAEKVQVAINTHLLQADDLREWYADHLLCSAENGAIEEQEPTAEDDVSDQRMADRVKAMLHGLDIARRRDAMKAA